MGTMTKRFLQLDDIRSMNDVDRVASVFGRLGYNPLQGSPEIPIEALELSPKSAESIWKTHLIADRSQGTESLQVLLFHLHPDELAIPSANAKRATEAVGNRMRSIAQSLCRRPSNFLLLGTTDYNQIAFVNPRKSFDQKMNLRVGVRKLLIDRHNPTAYDRDRLEAIAAHDLSPQQIYQRHCDAFDVEKLTKRFYEGYKELFEYVSKVLLDANSHPYFNDPIRLQQFVQRLLGRVMFLYFLQKKGFLNEDRDFLKTQYKQLAPDPEDHDFYTHVLEPLFFDILNKQRSNSTSQFGKIPYLNGGLFERDYGAGILDNIGLETPERVSLPNSLFDPTGDKGVLKFFNSYNFTVAENTPDNEDIAVDPEMLGKVFENLLESTERGKSGTFYTPRSIVHFMCVESLSRYLADETGLDIEFIKRLTEFDPTFPNFEVNELTKDQAKHLKQALTSVRICDPAVGSGAFPMGMMQIILSVKQAIAYREGTSVRRGSLAMSEWKREIVANNLFGVDIKTEAVEIAKLRMWLSMIVDIPHIDDVEPLPNLDYKLMGGNSLISGLPDETIVPDTSQDLQIELAVTPVRVEIEKLVELQREYFYAQSERRRDLKAQILAAEAKVFQTSIADALKFQQSKQQKIQREIGLMKGKASKAQSQEQKDIAEKLVQLKTIETAVGQGLRSLDFFQWKLHFNEVFRNKGGFNIVIGNPPYVRQEAIKSLKPLLEREYDCYSGTADLFVYFFERGFKLLKANGILTYISSNKYMRSKYGEKLRGFLTEKSSIHHAIDFGDASVFEAIAYPSILQIGKTAPKKKAQIKSLVWDAQQPLSEFSSVFRDRSLSVAQKELTADGWQLSSNGDLLLFEKLKAAGTPLGEYVGGKFYRGILTGLNDAFVVDRATRDRLIAEHPSSAEVLKPFLRGKDVKRWSANFAEQYLIKIESSSNKEHPWTGLPDGEAEKVFAQTYPAIYEFFQSLRNRLIARGDKGKYFWELRACKYWPEFEQPKIIYPDIYEHQSFTIDANGLYSANTCYFIPLKEIWLCGLLNSQIVEWLYSKLSNKVRGGYLRAFTDYIEQIPIPQASAADQKAISTLVKKCLDDAKGQNVAKWEAEIDDRVARLYGLTPDEIKLIRGE
jgi:adenine-specific DNA-methyltransferase